MTLLDNSNKQDILYTDTNNSYMIENINNNTLKIADCIIPIKNLNKNNQIVTIEYHAGLMSGFQLKKINEQLQYRWFRINTKSKKLIHGLWSELFLE